MTSLYGYDVVLEIGENAVSTVLLANAKTGNQDLYVPGEITREIDQHNVHGTLHLITRRVTINILENNLIGFVLEFNGGSFDGEYAGQSGIIPGFAGNVTTTIPLQLQPTEDQMQELQVNTAASTADIELTSDHRNEPYWPSVREIIITEIERILNETEFPPLVSFKVVPGELGSLDPLQFSQVEMLTVIGNFPRIEFFCNMRADAHSGNQEGKTTTRLARNIGFVVSISEQCMNEVVLAPVVSNLVDKSINALPKPMGRAVSMNFHGLNYTGIGMDLIPDKMHIFARGKKSGTCYKVKQGFDAYATLSVNAGELSVDLESPDPYFDIDIPWYCDVLTLGLSIGVEVMIDYIADSFLDLLTTRLLYAFGDDFFSYDSDDLALEGVVVQLRNAVIDDTAIHLESSVEADATLQGLDVNVEIERVVSRLGKEVLERISFDQKTCRGNRTYNWERIGYRNQISLTPIPQLLARPIQYRWIFRSQSEETSLEAGRGSLTLPASCGFLNFDTTEYDYVIKNITLDYFFEGDTLSLINDPEDGIYSIEIRLEAIDALGTQFITEAVYFSSNDHVRDVDGYRTDLAYCVMQKFRAKIDKLRFRPDLKLLENLMNPMIPEFDDGIDPLPPISARKQVALTLVEKLLKHGRFDDDERENMVMSVLMAVASNHPYPDAQVMPIIPDLVDIEVSPGRDYLLNKRLGRMEKISLANKIARNWGRTNNFKT